MATKDISDLQVLKAFAEMKKQRDSMKTAGCLEYADEILQRETGQPRKVCYRAIERAYFRDLIDFGVSLRSGWITDEGKKLLNS